MAMKSTCTHKEPIFYWQGLDRRALSVGTPTAKLEPFTDAISLVMDYKVGKKHPGKVDQLTLPSGGSENAVV